MLRRCCVVVPVILTILGSAVGVCARPAAVFIPHLERIQRNLPPELVLRLPSSISLREPSDIDESQLIVRIFPSEIPQRFTVSLFTCESSSHPCLLGSFSVERNTNASAQQELKRHQGIGERTPLANNIDGYLIDGLLQNPFSTFSTMMWQQNDMIYTISFPAIERETILAMAVSMAQEKPIYPVASRSASSP